jgi:hypothetical protein
MPFIPCSDQLPAPQRHRVGVARPGSAGSHSSPCALFHGRLFLRQEEAVGKVPVQSSRVLPVRIASSSDCLPRLVLTHSVVCQRYYPHPYECSVRQSHPFFFAASRKLFERNQALGALLLPCTRAISWTPATHISMVAPSIPHSVRCRGQLEPGALRTPRVERTKTQLRATLVIPIRFGRGSLKGLPLRSTVLAVAQQGMLG